MRRMVIAACLLLAATIASAQTVPNPNTVTFTPSSAHDEMVGDVALVTSYTLEVWQGTTMVRFTDLGKPTPVSGSISLPLVQTGLQPKTLYVVYITVVGPGGSTRSVNPSNPFVYLAGPPPAGSVTVR